MTLADLDAPAASVSEAAPSVSAPSPPAPIPAGGGLVNAEELAAESPAEEAARLEAAAAPAPSPPPVESPAKSPASASEPERTGFAALGLSPALLAALKEKGYETPTPVQAAVIPAVLAGRDVLGQAATGTGKTAAFALPLLDRLRELRTAPDAEETKAPAVLVMAPTRELAAQVAEAFRAYRGDLRADVLTVVGGEAFGPQLSALRRGVDVVVGTPGRLLDLLKRGSLDLSRLSAAVLDEADEMLDMGFQEEIEAVLDHTPPGRQTVLVSATLPPRINRIANAHLTDPVTIEIGRDDRSRGEDARVLHTAHVVRRHDKAAAIDRILEVDGAGPSLIFCRTRGGADDLTTELNRLGRRAAALHGGLTQDQRNKVVERLRGGTLNTVVATDVAARGLDVPELTHVFHADLPQGSGGDEAFEHRCGRVGRAGREGRVVTFLQPKERGKLRFMAKAVGADVEIGPLPGAADVVAGRLAKTRAALGDAATGKDFARLRTELAPVLDALAAEHPDLSWQQLAVAAAALAHRTAFGAAPAEELSSPPPPKFRDNGRDAGPRSGPSRNGRDPRDGRSGKKFGGKGGAFPDCPPHATRLWVGSGRDGGVRPGDLVGAIAGETHLSGGQIGAIKIAPTFSLVDVPADAADTVIQALSRGNLRGQKVTVRRDREG